MINLMLNFYHQHKFTPLLPSQIVSVKTIYDTYFFEEFFHLDFIAALGNSSLPKQTYETFKQISRSNSLEKILVDVHIIDSFPKIFSHPLSTLVFIYLIRHSEKDFYFGTVDKIAQDLNQSKTLTATVIADLEELNLLQIEGKTILKIKLNRTWERFHAHHLSSKF